MPARTLLSSEQRTRLFAIPTDTAEMTRHYVLDADDLALVGARRRAGNRLGFAVQLCALRHPGRVLDPSESLPAPMLAFVARQIGVDPALFGEYARRAETRREHMLELQRLLHLRSFGLADWRASLRVGAEAAWATDRGEPIVWAMLAHLRANGVLLPAAAVLERIGLAARVRARKKTFETLAAGLSDSERDTLMADASRGLGYHHLVNVAQWHIGDDNYVAARAAIVNAHHKHPMAAIWDDGTTSSSDGQYFRAGGRAGAGGSVNAKYGIDPGAVLCTHVSGHYGPFYTRVISATMSEAPYVLDGLHHHAHQTDLRIVEHYTDTAGATDHVFGLCHLLGYRFAPRIKDLKDRKLYTVEKPGSWPLLEPLIGGTVETAAILGQWTELMRLKASIETGAVVPSVILRKLAAAGAGNVLSRALRAPGRIERTLFTLQWLSDPALRQRSHAGLNKGEASNALRRAVFFHRQGEIRDRTFENQSFRASGLSLITAAIVHWNTVSLDRAVRQLRAQGVVVPDDLLAHVAPLGWEHIGLTGDYVWTEANPTAPFRPLREVRSMFLPLAA